ncbi:hypothetical protein BWI97_07315 [Siphonobacter sp. BAB-5405]|nr:hypothetical protein BWI97_07315 [Siphonobacter sp. BAB-5405]
MDSPSEYQIKVGDWVKTSYNTGPFIVERITSDLPEDRKDCYFLKDTWPGQRCYYIRCIHLRTYLANGQKVMKAEHQFSYLNGYIKKDDCWLSYQGDKVFRINIPEEVKGSQLTIF